MERADKIQNIKENFWSKFEIEYVRGYLKALEDNDEVKISEFEKFGKSPKHIVSNMNSLKHRKKFGFDVLEFNEHGWAKRIDWLEVEEIEFFDNKERYAGNSVVVGKGNNGKWAMGYDYATGSQGGGVWINEYADVYDSKDDAIVAGLNKIKELHKRAEESCKGDTVNFKKSYSKKILTLVEEKLKSIISPEPVQLSLF